MNYGIEHLCDEFEAGWKAGQRPRIDSFLGRVTDSERPQLFRELIHVELWWRRDESPAPELEEYQSRFPEEHALVTEMFKQFRRQPDANRQHRPAEQGPANGQQPFVDQVYFTDSEGEGHHVTTGFSEVPFGRYRLLRELGRGAMGVVFLAHDEHLDRKVALKMPRLYAGLQEEMLARFQREARVAAALRNPNICPVYDIGEIDGQVFISMAFIQGRPLRGYIRRGKPQDVRKTTQIIRRLASAMAEAHRAGIIHRDLKPGNIMLEHGRQPVIMDFGLARVNSEMESRLTHSGAILGTPLYMPPEQAAGDTDRIGPASDVYSLGVIFYEMLTGNVPFQGNTQAVMHQIATKNSKPLGEYGLQIDPAIESVVRRMMAKDPQDRYVSMDAVAEELTAYLKTSAPDVAGIPTDNTEHSPSSTCPELVEDAPHHPTHGEATISARQMVTTQNAAVPRSSHRRKKAAMLILGTGLIAALLTAMISNQNSTPDTTASDKNSSKDSTELNAESGTTSPAGLQGNAMDAAVVENSIGMRFVFIPAGRVEDTAIDPFFLGQHEVTQEQYERVMGHQPSEFGGQAHNPVENVTCKNAVDFCLRLSTLSEEKVAGNVYRLPNEVEWEYACLAGSNARYSFGDEASALGEYAWFTENSGETTHPVGEKKPNARGLFDIHGNVCELCSQQNGQLPQQEQLWLVRGGGWAQAPEACVVTFSDVQRADESRPFVGFRVVRTTSSAERP
ncbi:MAG: protein kinase [Fuerstiella sp.]|nr:protein kinase [Fuerstiella sp.]MCP4858151.1 protein kinase [Fuerstiella sp.]